MYGNMGPFTIMEWRQKIDLSQNIIELGSYALVYVGKTNTMKRGIITEIYLKEPNDSGGGEGINSCTSTQKKTTKLCLGRTTNRQIYDQASGTIRWRGEPTYD